MKKAAHRISFTLRQRDPREAELYDRIEPLLKRKALSSLIIQLLREELVMDTEQAEQARRLRRKVQYLTEQLVMAGRPQGQVAATLHDLITTGITRHEGNFVELKGEE